MIIVPTNSASKNRVMVVSASNTVVASGNSNSFAIPTHQAGDLLLGYATSEYGNQYNYANPTGWTSIYNTIAGSWGSGYCGMQVSYKVAQSSAESFGDWGGYAKCLGVVVLRNQNSVPIGQRSTHYWDNSNATSIYFDTIAPADTSGISAIIQLGHLSTFSGMSAFNTPISVPGTHTLQSSYNLYDGYGNGLLTASKNDTTTGGDTAMGNRNSNATFGRSSGVQIEVLSKDTQVSMVGYDSVGTGYQAYGAGTYSFNNTATAGSSVIVAGGMYGSGELSSVTYGGVAMTKIGSSTASGGRVTLYYLANVPGGTQTVSFYTPDQSVINAISFKNVSSRGTPQFSSAGSSGSISATCNFGQMIVAIHGFSVYGTTAGSTIVYSYENYRHGGYYGGLAFGYSQMPTTLSYSTSWNGVVGYVVLSPP